MEGEISPPIPSASNFEEVPHSTTEENFHERKRFSTKEPRSQIFTGNHLSIVEVKIIKTKPVGLRLGLRDEDQVAVVGYADGFAGLMSKILIGDVITHINGYKVSSVPDSARIIGDARQGDTLHFRILRDDTQTLSYIEEELMALRGSVHTVKVVASELQSKLDFVLRMVGAARDLKNKDESEEASTTIHSVASIPLPPDDGGKISSEEGNTALKKKRKRRKTGEATTTLGSPWSTTGSTWLKQMSKMQNQQQLQQIQSPGFMQLGMFPQMLNMGLGGAMFQPTLAQFMAGANGAILSPTGLLLKPDQDDEDGEEDEEGEDEEEEEGDEEEEANAVQQQLTVQDVLNFQCAPVHNLAFSNNSQSLSVPTGDFKGLVTPPQGVLNSVPDINPAEAEGIQRLLSAFKKTPSSSITGAPPSNHSAKSSSEPSIDVKANKDGPKPPMKFVSQPNPIINGISRDVKPSTFKCFDKTKPHLPMRNSHPSKFPSSQALPLPATQPSSNSTVTHSLPTLLPIKVEFDIKHNGIEKKQELVRPPKLEGRPLKSGLGEKPEKSEIASWMREMMDPPETLISNSTLDLLKFEQTSTNP